MAQNASIALHRKACIVKSFYRNGQKQHKRQEKKQKVNIDPSTRLVVCAITLYARLSLNGSEGDTEAVAVEEAFRFTTVAAC